MFKKEKGKSYVHVWNSARLFIDFPISSGQQHGKVGGNSETIKITPLSASWTIHSIQNESERMCCVPREAKWLAVQDRRALAGSITSSAVRRRRGSARQKGTGQSRKHRGRSVTNGSCTPPGIFKWECLAWWILSISTPPARLFLWFIWWA